MERMCKVCYAIVLAWVFLNAKANYDARAEVLELSGEDGGPSVRESVALSRPVRQMASKVKTKYSARRRRNN
jgi:hypothetical protein